MPEQTQENLSAHRGNSWGIRFFQGLLALGGLRVASAFVPIVTFFYVLRCCRKLYPDYEYEGFFSMFGMLTGTASNGMILLREIDPRFETPAANNLVLQTIPALAFGFPVLLLMGFAPQSLANTLITMGIMVGALLLFCLFIFRRTKKK